MAEHVTSSLWCHEAFGISAQQTVEAGHSLTLNPSWYQRGSSTRHTGIGKGMWLTARDGVYVLETQVAPDKLQIHPS